MMIKDLRLQIEYVEKDKITPYLHNPVHHSEQEIQDLMASIAEFGMIDPMLVHNDVIVAGHARFIAMQRLDYIKYPIIRLDHLSNAQRKALVIAHNKLGAEPEWIPENLEIIFDELGEENFDIELTGFAEFEIDDILNDNDNDNDKKTMLNEIMDIDDIYQIMIEVKTSQEQTTLLEEFQKRGLNCKALVL